MASSALRRFTGQGLKPCVRPEDAVRDAVRLIHGTYLAGTVLGQWATWTAANEVQTITIDYTPTGGSFYLLFDGLPVGPVLYNSTSAQLQTILDAHASIGTGGTVVTGGPLPGTPLVVTFSGTNMASLWQPTMTVMSNSLTGGTPGTLAVAKTTPGRAVGGQWGVYDDALSTGQQVARGILASKTVVNTYGEHVVGGGQWNEKSYSTPIYTGGYFRTADLTGLDAAAVTDLGRLVYGTTSLLSNTGTILYVR